MFPQNLSSSKILQFLGYALNLMVIPQMEICSFQFQRLPKVHFVLYKVEIWEDTLKMKQKEVRKRTCIACM